MIFNFALFLLWASMAVMILIVGPFFMPQLLPETVKERPFLGYGCALLAAWNLVRWWNVRSYQKQRRLQASMEEAYHRRTHPTEPVDNTKPVLHPEFQFDDEARRNPPAAPPNS